MKYVTRFAPSPTGPLHLGHAFSALTAFDRARERDGTFLLRIDDNDISRCRPEWETQIYDDLHWLGLSWRTPPMRVSDRTEAYMNVQSQLVQMDILYPCSCTRGDIQRALSAPQEGVTFGPDGPIYPGTCRHRKIADALPGDALRLNMARAISCLGDVTGFAWRETGENAGIQYLDARSLLEDVGDIVLFRKETGMVAYHLSVVVDDAAQEITEAVRGLDLQQATQIHRLLQALLGLPTPDYHHHRLIRDETGKRLAKRSDSKAISKFRAEGATLEDIRRMVGL